MTATEAARAGRVQGIDLLRGVAIGLVMLRHAFPDQLQGAGVVGVVMFFALSAYLITGVLLAELRDRGTLDLRRFYTLRALRLVPALVGMVVGFALVTIVLDPLGDRDELTRTVVVALTYTADLPFHHGSAAIFHLWTLAMEEQFYLLWPAVLVFSRARHRVGSALAATGLVCLAACVATLVTLGSHPDVAYPLPTSWAVCFVVGGAARVYADSAGRAVARAQLAVPAALAALGGLSVVALRGHALTYLVAAPVIALLTTVLLVSWRSWHVVRSPLLRPLVALGTVSYGAYLWNYPLTLWLRPSPDSTSLSSSVLAMVLTVAAAALSWRLVEQPLQRLRRPRVPERAVAGSRT